MGTQAKKIFKTLINLASSSSFIAYGELAELINNKSVTADSLRVYLGEVSTYCKEHGLPAITSLVVNKETRTPGLGFYEVNGLKEESLEFWLTQYRQTVQFNWSIIGGEDD